MESHCSRRRFLRVTAALLGAGVASACGATPTPTAIPKPPTATAVPPAATKAAPTNTPAPAPVVGVGNYPMNKSVKGTVRFWHAWGGVREALVVQMVKDFQAAYPSATVEQSVIVSGRNEKILTALAGGDPPEVAMTSSADLPAFAQDGAVESLEPFIARDKLDVKQIFYPSELAARQFQGTTYMLPHVTATAMDMLFFKKTVFADAGLDPNVAPKTWADLQTLAEKIVKKTGTEVTRHALPIDYNTGTLFLTWLYLNGGVYVSDDQKQIRFQEAPGVEVVEWMLDWTKKYIGDYSKFRPATTAGAEIAESYRKLFAADKLGMYIGGSWMLYQFQDYKVDGKDYVMHLIPPSGKPGTKFGTPTVGTHGLFIPKGAKNQDAAWEWIKWGCMSESYYRFILAQMRPSPMRAVNEMPELAKSSENWPVIVKALETDLAVPVSPAYPKISTEIQNMQDSVLFGKSTPKDAVAAAAKASQQHLDEWNARIKK